MHKLMGPVVFRDSAHAAFPLFAAGDSSHRALLHFGQIAGRFNERGNHLCPHRLHPFCSIDFVMPKGITSQVSVSRIILDYFIGIQVPAPDAPEVPVTTVVVPSARLIVARSMKAQSHEATRQNAGEMSGWFPMLPSCILA